MINRTLHIISILAAAVCLVLLALPGEGLAKAAVSDESGICLGCHGSKDLFYNLPDGEKVSLFIDGTALAGSAHRSLSCTSCHTGFSGEHPNRQFKSKRGLTLASAGSCQQCHAFRGGIHKKMLGDSRDRTCVDCHGAHAVKAVEDGTDSCVGCHKQGISMSFKDGTTLSARIDAEGLRESVHGKLRCTDCHFGFSVKEHPVRNFRDKRSLTIMATESCRRCHFDKYTKTLESIHFNVLAGGNMKAPVCVDCHGAHDIESGRTEKILSARRCEKCHAAIYRTYTMSVHGKALISDHNQDVPVCSDCHKAHDIADAHMTDFRNDIPQMCAKCHANEGLMRKYGLSTAVLKSYLEDFHGVTLTFYRKQDKPVRHIAVCSDCHGMHDIMRTKGPDAVSVKENLLKKCQKCHPGATRNFPDSWISHYDPSFKRAPLVYAVNLGYSLFIPFMIVGLVLQIGLHVWRYAVNR